MNYNFIAQTFGKSTYYTDIPSALFKEYNVKKGLRNEDGTGVRVGLTRISDVVGYDYVDGVKTDTEGKLYYRGYRLKDLVSGKGEGHFGYEEVCFLLLFGYLPNKSELKNFKETISDCYSLPKEFLEMNLLRAPSKDLMNLLQITVLSLYSYDEKPDDNDPYQTVLKGINIIGKLPLIICYGYQSQMHHYQKKSLVIHYPRPDFSIAENILYMLRADSKFTPQEAKMLDTLLMVHADHGGGNNSTFTSVAMASTGTDIYSTLSGAIGSLKGPKHGGANVSCYDMMQAVIDEIGFTKDEEKIRDVITRILAKDFYDNSGLVYGMGHAVYTVSDPRAEILREYCRDLAMEKGRMEEFEFRVLFEKIAREMISKKTGKVTSNNVDYYSGFAYDMLNIPKEIYTPLFACARAVGWLAHNIENKLYDGKIMRPATKYVGEPVEFKPVEGRK